MQTLHLKAPGPGPGPKTVDLHKAVKGYKINSKFSKIPQPTFMEMISKWVFRHSTKKQAPN